MAKQSMKARELKRLKLNSKYEIKRKQIKKLVTKTYNFDDKLNLQKEWQKLPRNSSKTRLRNRCWRTGRSRGYYRDFGLSRHVLREMAHSCLLPGVRKSSW